MADLDDACQRTKINARGTPDLDSTDDLAIIVLNRSFLEPVDYFVRMSIVVMLQSTGTKA